MGDVPSCHFSHKPSISSFLHVSLYNVHKFLHIASFIVKFTICIAKAAIHTTNSSISICSSSLSTRIFYKRHSTWLALFHNDILHYIKTLLIVSWPCIIECIFCILICRSWIRSFIIRNPFLQSSNTLVKCSINLIICSIGITCFVICLPVLDILHARWPFAECFLEKYEPRQRCNNDKYKKSNDDVFGAMRHLVRYVRM